LRFHLRVVVVPYYPNKTGLVGFWMCGIVYVVIAADGLWGLLGALCGVDLPWLAASVKLGVQVTLIVLVVAIKAGLVVIFRSDHWLAVGAVQTGRFTGELLCVDDRRLTDIVWISRTAT